MADTDPVQALRVRWIPPFPIQNPGGVMLADFAKKFTSWHAATKPICYYEKYDEFFREHSIVPKNILEIGVLEGESTKIFSACYPHAKLVGIDLTLREIDFSGYPNVTYLKCDQTDQAGLSSIIERHFPEGVDLVIDDASHIGFSSSITFETVFPYLNSEGLYIIEDWGTGYWDDWPDGGRYQQFPLSLHENSIPRRIPSHDFGMVGFVKSLVDYTHESAIKPRQRDPGSNTARLKLLQFSEGVCFAIKA
jgi:hypothetical protein